MYLIRNYFRGDSGVTAVEYTLIAALIAIAIIAGIALFSPAITNMFT
ncbi:MAG: Flp family type IVb pilin, partial [Proteobacteria bacterium]|nr:Flp family type IVb pilin [Pseudomonadota bacterium]